MTTKQGDVGLLNDPVAQDILQSPLPAHLAYNWSDGTPRVVPIWFHWNGQEVVFGSPPDAPKCKVLHNGDKVAVTIDSVTMPYKVLMIRGSVRVDIVDGIAQEYAAAGRRVLGEEGGNAWLAQLGPICPQMMRIFVTPDWAAIQDFETRFPNAIERAMEKAQAGA